MKDQPILSTALQGVAFAIVIAALVLGILAFISVNLRILT